MKAGVLFLNVAILSVPTYLFFTKLDLPEIKISNRDVKLSVLFLGDTHPGENYFVERESKGKKNLLKEKGYDYSFRKLKPLLSSADFVVGNLLTPLTNETDLSKKDRYIYWSSPIETPAVLSRIGVSAVSLANNHSMDQGTKGLMDTFDALEKRNIRWFGAGTDDKQAYDPLSLSIGGGGEGEIPIKIFGVFDYRKSYEEKLGFYAKPDSPGVAKLDGRRIRQLVGRLKKTVAKPYVIAFPHFGPNYKWRSKEQRTSARSMIRSGVDLVVGHGAHQFQQLEQYRGKWILYNIGNFVMNSPGRYKKTGSPPYSVLAKLEVYKEKDTIKKALKLYPILSDNKSTRYQPRLLRKAEFFEFCEIMVEKSHSAIDVKALKRGRDKYGKFLHIALD